MFSMLCKSKTNKGGKNMELGNKLKDARNEKGITQEHAAELLCVSRQTISNWENNKSYPDIISVIKMSDIYSVSLDHLLKEKKSMNQTYQEFLEESTNTVKAKKTFGKIILLSTYFIIWVVTMIVLWQNCGAVISGLNLVFKCILLPLLLFLSTILVAKNDFLGKGNWICVIIGGITFFTVPYVNYVEEFDISTLTFQFPNFPYMFIGVLISVCGIVLGTFWKKKLSSK